MLLAVVVAGCSAPNHYDLDAGNSDATVVEAKTLEIVGEPTISLTTTDQATLTVRLLDASGFPMAGSEVRFALDGRAHDSTLLEVSSVTDAMGLARTTLRAGTVIAAFRVRASTDDAASVSFDVAVGDAGFGRMEVTPTYDGTRELPQVVVGIFTDATCDDEIVRRDPGDRVQRQSADDELVRFLGLPVGPSYAVAVRGEGLGGTLLAWGCADGFEITAMETTAVEVHFDDEPLLVDGAYRTTATFDVLGTSDRMAERLDGARATLLPESDATLILDAAEQQLLDAGDTTGAAALAAARAGGYDLVYQGLLETMALGPTEAHDGLVARVRAGLAQLSIIGRIRIAEGVITHSVLQLGVGAGSLDVMVADLEVPSSIVATATGEQLTIDALTVELSASIALRALLTHEAYAQALSDATAWLTLEAGCQALPAPTEPIGCDLECLEAACEAVLATYYEGALAEVATLDAERSAFELSGEASLEDTRSDLQADTVTGTIGGAWTGPAATTPEMVESPLTGERLVPPT